MRSTYPLFLALTPLAMASLGGCASIPPGRDAIDTVNVSGAHTVDSDELLEKLATRESPKFLGLFRGVIVDYLFFDRFVLERDLARVERFYKARGFYDARARAGRVTHKSNDHVVVEILVEEGPPSLTKNVVIAGVEGALVKTAERAANTKLPLNEPFDEDKAVEAEHEIQHTLMDEGYAYAKVQRSANVDVGNHAVEAHFKVDLGPRATFGPVTIEGFGELPESRLRESADIPEGKQYSATRLDEARQHLLELGVLSGAEIEPQLPEPPPPNPVIPIKVRVTMAGLRTLRFGGGSEFDVIKTDVHLLVGWESRNFLGGLRRFRVDAKPGVVLFPTRIPDFQAPTDFLPELRAQSELRQPALLERHTTGIARAQFSVYPVLLSPTFEADAPVLGYKETLGSVGAERTFMKGVIYTALSQNVQYSQPFTYKGDRSPELRDLLISYIDLVGRFDLRNDPVHPRKGFMFSNEVQFAGVGGQVRDVRVQPEVRGYVPITRRVVLAARGTVGVLFPLDYGDTFGRADPSAFDIQKLFFRGFFGGGPTSNRGYPLRGIGPHGVVPFFNPAAAADSIARDCDASLALGKAAKNDPNAPTPPPIDPRCLLPLGGTTLWEASVETRILISGPLSTATFCDMGDVSAKALDFRFGSLHLSCGVGLRYDTPVGPIRLDAAYRIPGLQYVTGQKNPNNEPEPSTILGLPVGVAFGIGEAF